MFCFSSKKHVGFNIFVEWHDLPPGLESNKLAATFSDEELKRAYRQAVRKSHPDAPGGSAKKLQKVKDCLGTSRYQTTGFSNSDGSLESRMVKWYQVWLCGIDWFCTLLDFRLVDTLYHEVSKPMQTTSSHMECPSKKSLDCPNVEPTGQPASSKTAGSQDAYDYLMTAPSIKVWDEGKRQYGANSGPGGASNSGFPNVGSSKPKPDAMRREVGESSSWCVASHVPSFWTQSCLGEWLHVTPFLGRWEP